ncbi:Rho GTPase-activating protein 30 [Rhodotorula toruloides]|nr:Rho GTPase-activating protein 30 [Rhodotorula toruloides]
MSLSSPPQPATHFGLATQLRTPPLDGASYSPASTHSSQAKKLTPAMRAEGRDGSPRLFTVPQWSAKDSPRSAYSASTDGPYGSLDMARADSRGVMSDVGYEPLSPTSKGHSRTQSSPLNGFKADGSPTMQRLYRPESPTSATPPTPQQVHIPSEVTATGAPIFNKVDFSFGSQPPLDLGITLTSPSYSTYKATSTPLARSASADAVHTPPLPPASKDDVPGTPYAAEVRVSVAQRVEKAPSFRKASLAELNAERPASGPLFEDYRRPSSATTGSGSSSVRNGSQDLSVPRLRPPRASSPGGTNRPVGQGLRSSYAGSSISDSGVATASLFRRASSVYVPNSPGGLTAVAVTSVGAGPGSQKITPGAKLPLNLLTLSRRTAHVSDVPGYAWRLNLLEKLELIMGSFLRIEDAEAILSIGNSSEKKKKRSESRKSQIGMPTPSSDSLRQPEESAKKVPEPKTFFSRMKRVLSVQGPPTRESPSSSNAAKKVVFGAPLAQVAEYGFVTSMIAGQRHDLPGVCFSTVEEIYRRGQGSKVPGLMQMQGEPGRIAKLVQIYNTPPDYGEHHDLSIESIHNVTSLLKRYLRDLPEPVLDQRLWRLFQVACVDSTNSLKARIASAQIILRLLPTPNFSLLVYLVAFLSQMPLFPENKLSLATVSGIFGAMIMAPRPAPQKKPAKGEMVISGPGESVESAGATAKKGEVALRWLLEHWSSVADGLLDADFDIDPATIVDNADEASPDRSEKTSLLAPTLDVIVPQGELHIQQPAAQEETAPLAPPIQLPRDAPAPPVHEQAWSQRQPFSPVVEQHTAELDSIPRFEDVSKTYNSQPCTPVAQDDTPLHSEVQRLGSERSGSSAHSHASPRLDPLAAAAFATPKSPSIYQEESGPPTPQKEIQQPHFPSIAAVLPSQPEEDELEREERPPVAQQDEEEEHGSPHDSTDEPPRLSSTHSSASSEHSVSIKTPPQSALTHEAGVNGHSKTFDADSRPISMRDTSVLDDVVNFDETSVYSFPAPPISPTSATRPSPFLIPSPFLSQAELDAARAAEHAKEVQSMPPPPNAANYANRSGPSESESAKQIASPLQHRSRPSVEEKALVLPPSREVVKAEPGPPLDEEDDDAPPPLPQKSPTPNGIGINGLPSSRTSSTLRLSDHESLERVGAEASPSKANPGRASASLLRTVDEQLRETQQLVEKQRQEVQSLWQQLTDLELERTAERAEMIDLRQEVESFKERMTKRLSRSLNEQEKKKLETAEHKARDSEARVRVAQEEARRAREELARVEEKRRKEQADAKSQIEALEAQLGSIRAVLLGGAGLKI